MKSIKIFNIKIETGLRYPALHAYRVAEVYWDIAGLLNWKWSVRNNYA